MKTLISIAAALALLASPAYAVSNENTDVYTLREQALAAFMDGHTHAGEIWTICDTWFMACTFDDPTGNTATCQGYVPIDNAFWLWVAAPSVVNVGPGYHYTWTEGAAGGNFFGAHNSASLVGTTCAEEFFGYIYTYTSGAGSMA